MLKPLIVNLERASAPPAMRQLALPVRSRLIAVMMAFAEEEQAVLTLVTTPFMPT